MSFSDDPRYTEYIKQKKEAEREQDVKRSEIERMRREVISIDLIITARTIELKDEFIQEVQAEEEKILSRYRGLKDEYVEQTSTFCQKLGHHTYRHRRGYVLLPEFGKSQRRILIEKNVCIICGREEIGRWAINLPHRDNFEDIIQKAVENSKNPELQKVAKRIIEIRKELSRLDKELEKMQESRKEICSLLGHNIKPSFIKENMVLSCKCCGEDFSRLWKNNK